VETEAVCMLQARPDQRSVARALKASQLKRRQGGHSHPHSHGHGNGKVRIHDVDARSGTVHSHGDQPCEHAH